MRERRRARQAAVLLAFAMSVIATAATSPASVPISIAPSSSTLHLDPDHPVALARVVVKVTAEATSGRPYYDVNLWINDLAPSEGGTPFPYAATPVSLIVMSAVPGLLPVAPSEAPAAEPVPSAWQRELSRQRNAALPIQCDGGPCERAFWLVAQLADDQAAGVDIDWKVEGTLRFPANTWPSGAGATITIDPPIAIAGPIPQLVQSTDADPIVLGPTSPAVARVVEVGIESAGITGNGQPVGALSVDLVGRSAQTSYDRQPIVRIYPLDGVEAPGGGPVPSPAVAGADPFSGCDPGADCTRRFLVTFAWNGIEDADERYDWTLSVRRVDLVAAWTSPAELSASIKRRIDIDASVAPTTVHLEGDEQSVDGFADPQIRLGTASDTTATDVLAPLLPVPAVMRYRVVVANEGPNATPRFGDSAIVRFPGDRPSPEFYLTFATNDVAVVANPMAGCRLGALCGDLEMKFQRQAPADKEPPPAFTAHWTLDVLGYSYVDVPITLSVVRER
ncbi:MAG TPA: hypothetical protein VJ850_08140 [Candidatus Limnocylindrales bacterium]|nr:hypothetical protein [Candidatus Limnocylindrales bacterium]